MTRAATLLTILLFIVMAFPAFAKNDLKKADELYAQRASTPLFGQALAEYEFYYAKNKPEYDKAMFLVKAYYHYAERYFGANQKKAISNYRLGMKWAQYALELKPGDYEAEFYNVLCKLRAKLNMKKIIVDEAVKEAKASLEDFIKKSPDMYHAHLVLGTLYRETEDWPVGYRDYTESEKSLKKACELAPEDHKCLLEYAKTLVKLKKYGEARKALARLQSLKIIPEQKPEIDRLIFDGKQLLGELKGKF